MTIIAHGNYYIHVIRELNKSARKVLKELDRL
jgi:hypothetical protein